MVRSLYLDSPSWKCVHEKTAGLSDRWKLRVRGYISPDGQIDRVKLEVKHRRNSKIAKTTAVISAKQYAEIRSTLLSGPAPSEITMANSPQLMEFFRLQRLFCMRPVANIQFRRQALSARTDRTVRITFDDELKAAHGTDLFDEQAHARRLLIGQLSILEVKLEGQMPFWLHHLIRKYQLQTQSVSKYVLGALTLPFGLDHIS